MIETGRGLVFLAAAFLPAVTIIIALTAIRRGPLRRRRVRRAGLALAASAAAILLAAFIAPTEEQLAEKRMAREARALERVAAAEDKAAAARETREHEEAACRSELQCWGDKFLIQAGFACDEHVERLATFQYRWTDGALEPKFSRFRWLDRASGTVTYLGDRIEFQNGFGAWQGAIYSCDFDPLSEKVLAVSGEPGRFPVD